jgi:PAS domain S-box-containing protein
MPIVEQRGANIVILPKEIHNRFLLSPSDDTFLFSSLLEHAPFIVWVSDQRGRLRYVNQTWLEFTGRPIEMEIGDGWISNVHPEDVKERVECFQLAASTCLPFNAEYRIRRTDGEYRWIGDMAKSQYRGKLNNER